MKGWARILMLGLMTAFAFFVVSRALLAMSVLALAISPQNVRDRKVLLIPAVPLSLALLFYSGFTLDNFSDKLRLQILQVSYRYAIGRGLYPFNFGEAAFTDFLNIYPIYRRLEIQHAHNLFLQIWVSYGLVPLGIFLTWLAFLARQAWTDRNGLLLGSLAVLTGFGMIEALITDIRAFAEIMFVIGYVMAAGRGTAASMETWSGRAVLQVRGLLRSRRKPQDSAAG
jgi:O-antigen ligase